MRRVMLIAVALVAALGLTASTATAETGITAKNVTIGGTFPLTGPASAYAPIPVAMKAYFSYINTRKGADGKRGVFGRQIVFKYLDDGYNPANSVQLTRQLVEQDNVFAIVGSLGTEVNLAIRPYLNAKKVPQLLNATGASTWGRDWKKYPWTTGWQPDYVLEGTIYGQAIARNSPSAKIAVLYQNDDYGKDYLQGLETGLGGKTSNIVGKESYEVSAPDVKSQIAKLRATGATVFVILATPKFTVQSYVIAKALGWTPTGDLHELGVGHRHDPHARPEVRRGHTRQQHVHDPVHKRSCECEVGRRRGHEAVPRRDDQVLPERVERGGAGQQPQPLRRGCRPRVRAAPAAGRAEPDPCRDHEGRAGAGPRPTRSCFRATCRRPGRQPSSRSTASRS